jgi:SAM-dependent methyltransferase
MCTDTSDWNRRYTDRDTPWDTNQPSAELARVLCEWAIEPCRVIEIGCGTGTNAVFLAERGFQVTAFDVSPLAIEQAERRAAGGGVTVEFFTANILDLPNLKVTFPFVFDRGVYHVVREVDVGEFVETVVKLTSPGGFYLALAGNANEKDPAEGGPPRVSAQDICRDFEAAFQLVQLREFRFDPSTIDGKIDRPLAWSILMRRR